MTGICVALSALRRNMSHCFYSRVQKTRIMCRYLLSLGNIVVQSEKCMSTKVGSVENYDTYFILVVGKN